MSELKNILLQRKTDILNDLIKMVSAESPSTNKKLVDATGNIIKDIIQKRLGSGYKCTEYPNQYYGNHLKFEKINSTSPRILFLCHFDTVWELGELPIKVEEETIYGPGIFDMKAGIISCIWAISILESTTKLPFSPVFLFTSDEEIGSPSSRALIESEASACDAVFVLEPPEAQTHSLKTARKGVGIYKIDIQGKSSHSGNHHEDGINAILEAAYLVEHLQGLTDYSKGTTVNVGVIRGGTSTNVVPEKASLEFDFRVSTMEEANRLIKEISSLKTKNPLARLQVKGELNRPPLERNEGNRRLYALAQEVGQKLGMNISESSVGGASDGNFTSGLGIPTLDGLGIPGDGPHARNEHIRFDLFPAHCAFLAELSVTVGEALSSLKK